MTVIKINMVFASMLIEFFQNYQQYKVEICIFISFVKFILATHSIL